MLCRGAHCAPAGGQCPPLHKNLRIIAIIRIAGKCRAGRLRPAVLPQTARRVVAPYGAPLSAILDPAIKYSMPAQRIEPRYLLNPSAGLPPFFEPASYSAKISQQKQTLTVYYLNIIRITAKKARGLFKKEICGLCRSTIHVGQ